MRAEGPFIPRPSSFESRQCRGQLLDLEGLDDVAVLDVLELLDADAALEALPNLGDIVLEVAQRADLSLQDDAVVAQQPDAGRARNDALGDHAPRDQARLRHLE